MFYCIDYENNCGFKYYNAIGVAEMKAPFSKMDRSLIPFMEKYSNKIIVFDLSFQLERDFEGEKEQVERNLKNTLTFLLAFYERFKNIKIAIPSFSNAKVRQFADLISELDTELPFYFNEPIENWSTLHAIVKEYHPCDVLIGGDLCFDIVSVSKFLKPQEINVRVIPNIAQSSEPLLKNTDVTSFFIRPEDQFEYSPYVDIFEIKAPFETLNTIFEIYCINFKWLNKVSEIVTFLNSDLDGRFVLPTFAQRRLGCRRKCQNPFYSCKHCHMTESNSVVAASKDIVFFQGEALDISKKK